jgi:murein L,D-transpeptidase YcbB/YkuD
MGFSTQIVRLSLAAAVATAAGSAAAEVAAAPYRASIFLPPPLVALFEVEKTPGAAANDSPRLDLAWELLDEDQRALASSLDGWAKAPAEGANASERRRQRAVIASAYAARGFKSFWRDGGARGAAWREAAQGAARRLREAGEDGLDLRAYAIPAVENDSASALDELAFSEAVAAYAAQASGARIDPARLSRLIGARPTPANLGQALAAVSAADARADETLQDFNPPHHGYRALRSKLAELRAQRALETVGTTPRVALAATGAPRDDGLSPADRPLFAPHGKKAGARSRAPVSRIEAEIIANMERWRWLPRDMGDSRIEVNIPDFELALVRDGAVAHRTRVIVGKQETPTPVFSDAMEYVIVNPYWNVPPSILNNEMLPRHGGDASALEQRGFKVSYRKGRLIVRQPPGAGNALGRIKFMFPNDFAVYLHDTPSRGLFAASRRAFSHGCMRVQEPFALAEAVLGPGGGWSEERVRKLIGGSERYINLAKPLPIHIEYFTAYVDEYGRLQLRDDLYGYSARVRAALGLNG